MCLYVNNECRDLFSMLAKFNFLLKIRNFGEHFVYKYLTNWSRKPNWLLKGTQICLRFKKSMRKDAINVFDIWKNYFITSHNSQLLHWTVKNFNTNLTFLSKIIFFISQIYWWVFSNKILYFCVAFGGI